METTVRYGQELYLPKTYDVGSDSEAQLMLASADDVPASGGLYPDGVMRHRWNGSWGRF